MRRAWSKASTVDRLIGGERADPLHPTKDGPHPHHQLAKAERLRQVVIGSYGEAGHLVRLLGTGREHQHGDPPVPLDLPADLQSVHPREHEVEDHEVGMNLLAQPDGLGTVAGHHDLEALALEPGSHRLRDGLLVVDHQDGLLGHGPIVSAACGGPSGALLRSCGEGYGLRFTGLAMSR